VHAAALADEPDDVAQAERWAEMPQWLEVTESLREAGLLVSSNPLLPTASATRVRMREGHAGTEWLEWAAAPPGPKRPLA
jgi:hypothetical protein